MSFATLEAKIKTFPAEYVNEVMDFVNFLDMKINNTPSRENDETDYLLATDANRRHLLHSLSQAENGDVMYVDESSL